MTNVTYVFAGNRKDRYYSKDYGPKEFFYGIENFEKPNFDINIIEPQYKKRLFINPLNLFDFVFKKIFNLPVYSNEFFTIKNLKILLKTDKLILINETTMCSLSFLILLVKIFKKIDSHVFVMGLYSKKLRFPFLKSIHFFLIKLFLLPINSLFFLGQGELNKARKTHPKLAEKFILFPFFIDTDFWSIQKSNSNSKNKKILYVGNDGNRNPNLFLEIVSHYKHFEFEAVTNNSLIYDSRLQNLKVHNNPEKIKLSDEELKEVYLSAKFVIIPLKESNQPSGQSVSLQAMSLGIPVVISDTEGFWDDSNFKNNSNIFIVENNNLEGWIEKIDKIFENDNLCKEVSDNAKKIVHSKFNLEEFKEKLFYFIF